LANYRRKAKRFNTGKRWRTIEKKGLEGLLIKLKGIIDAQFKLANVHMVQKALSTSTSK
jgi:hypothetical protein